MNDLDKARALLAKLDKPVEAYGQIENLGRIRARGQHLRQIGVPGREIGSGDIHRIAPQPDVTGAGENGDDEIEDQRIARRLVDEDGGPAPLQIILIDGRGCPARAQNKPVAPKELIDGRAHQRTSGRVARRDAAEFRKGQH